METRLAGQKISLDIKPAARSWLTENGYEPSFGARPMRRLIQREIEDPVALLIVSGKVSSGDTVRVDGRSGKITVSVKRSKPRIPQSQINIPIPVEESEILAEQTCTKK